MERETAENLSKSERTRLAILESAAVVLSRQPDATLNDIAQEAGVGRATLHRHFRNRDDLVRSLALQALSDVSDICRPALDDNGSAREALEKIVDALVPLGHRYRFLATATVTITDPEVKGKYDRHLYRLAELGDRLKEEGHMAAAMPTAWIVAVIDALVYAAWFTLEDGYIAKRDAPGLALRTMLSGLA